MVNSGLMSPISQSNRYNNGENDSKESIVNIEGPDHNNQATININVPANVSSSLNLRKEGKSEAVRLFKKFVPEITDNKLFKKKSNRPTVSDIDSKNKFLSNVSDQMTTLQVGSSQAVKAEQTELQ